MSPPADLDGLSAAALRALVVQLLDEVRALKQVVADQRAEIARLKGLKGPPSINPSLKPSGMEQASERKSPTGGSKRRGRGGKQMRRVAIEDQVLTAEVPAGSRFKGYQSFLIQDLVLRPVAIRYRRERWVTPDGRTVVAPLPSGIDGHFGPELRRFVLAQYHQGQVTVPRLVALLEAIGIEVSKRQVVRLLIGRQGRFLDEARDVLRAGLETAAWITVDDTGARHKATNGFCTQIGSDDAGQFNVGRHGLCWVHAERLVHKLDAFTDGHYAAQQRIRGLIWWFYGDLKAYRRDPTPKRKAALRARFNRIFQRQTGFATLDRLLARLHANKAELLMVLDHPEIPLHTNGSENDIRCHVTKRKISGGTSSDTGRDCRDAFLGLAKTCAKLAITFWDYLGARLDVAGNAAVPYLPELVSRPCPTP